MNEVVYWIDPQELNQLYTSGYWNNVDEEKNKSWWIDNSNANKLLEHLEKTGLITELNIAINEIDLLNSNKNKLEVVDLAAGTCWLSAILSNISSISFVHAVDISRHRLELLAPKTFQLLRGDYTKLKRYLGSFYDLKFGNSSIDYLFLSQAFHHAHNPIKLLLECNRVLKKNGKMVLIGEHNIEDFNYLKKVIRYLITKRKLELDPQNFYPPNNSLGDHYYLKYQYKFLFEKCGFSFHSKKINTLNSVVYFGCKTRD